MSRSKGEKAKSKCNTVPTEQDWGDYQRDLDQNSAHEKFFGRTNEEMQPRFRRNLFSYEEELYYMPEIPFRYYTLGFRDFVMAGNFEGRDASGAASCFLGLVEQKLQNNPRHIMPIMPDLFPAIEHVAHNQSAYDADVEIYGHFLDTLKRIQDLYERCGGRAYSDQLNAFLRK